MQTTFNMSSKEVALIVRSEKKILLNNKAFNI